MLVNFFVSYLGCVIYVVVFQHFQRNRRKFERFSYKFLSYLYFQKYLPLFLLNFLLSSISVYVLGYDCSHWFKRVNVIFVIREIIFSFDDTVCGIREFCYESVNIIK